MGGLVRVQSWMRVEKRKVVLGMEMVLGERRTQKE